MKNFALIISVISLSISIFSFLIPLYKSTFRLGVSNQKAEFDNDAKVMFVDISFINESSIPVTIQGLTITEEKFQSYSSNQGELLRPDEIRDNGFTTLPIVIPPYSLSKGKFAFRFPITFKSDYYLEVETSKLFLVFPFNPSPHITSNIGREIQGRWREENVHWQQSKFRQIPQNIIDYLRIK